MSRVLVLVFAGGEGSRIGGGKPWRTLGGERLIDRAVRLARRYASDVAIGVREPVGSWPAPTIVDVSAIEGPLAGLLAGLEATRIDGFERLLTIPCDMPFLPSDLLSRLAEGHPVGGAAVAASGGAIHPVCGLWDASALGSIAAYVASGRRSLRGAIDAVPNVRVEWDGGSADPFANVNSQEDLSAAESRLARD